MLVIIGISLILRSGITAVPWRITRRRLRDGIILLTATTTLIRLELALFVLPVVLSLVLLGRLSVRQAVVYGATGGFGSLRASLHILM
jgi:alpha-1,6-mannosyltransferase